VVDFSADGLGSDRRDQTLPDRVRDSSVDPPGTDGADLVRLSAPSRRPRLSELRKPLVPTLVRPASDGCGSVRRKTELDRSVSAVAVELDELGVSGLTLGAGAGAVGVLKERRGELGENDRLDSNDGVEGVVGDGRGETLGGLGRKLGDGRSVVGALKERRGELGENDRLDSNDGVEGRVGDDRGVRLGGLGRMLGAGLRVAGGLNDGVEGRVGEDRGAAAGGLGRAAGELARLVGALNDGRDGADDDGR
jgi:hypothetical protein